MMRLVVKLSTHHGQDFSGHVGHIISRVDAAENVHRLVVDLWLVRGDVRGKPVSLR